MNINAIQPVEDGILNVIIETPKGSQNKYNYDPQTGLFKLKKMLPLGMHFPYDFGFVPNTKAEDGDPLDVLVIMDQPAYPGCLVPCRVIGILVAEQKEKDGETVRNDRIVAVSSVSSLFAHVQELEQLGEKTIKGIETFFTDYNKHEGKVFTPLKWRGPAKVLKIVEKHKLE